MGEDLMAIEIHFEKRIINNNVIREADAGSHRGPGTLALSSSPAAGGNLRRRPYWRRRFFMRPPGPSSVRSQKSNLLSLPITLIGPSESP